MPRYCQSKKKLHSIVGGPYHIMNYWFQSLYKILQYNRAVIVISDTNAVRVTLVECSEAISTHFHIPYFLFPNSPFQYLLAKHVPPVVSSSQITMHSCVKLIQQQYLMLAQLVASPTVTKLLTCFSGR